MRAATPDAVKDIVRRAARIAALGVIVETFDTAAERKSFVLGMYERGAIAEHAADLLIEAYGLETA